MGHRKPELHAMWLCTAMLTDSVLHAVTLAVLFVLCLMAGCGRLLCLHRQYFSSWPAAGGNAEAVGQEAVEQGLKRITPVIVIQPSQEARPHALWVDVAQHHKQLGSYA